MTTSSQRRASETPLRQRALVEGPIPAKRRLSLDSAITVLPTTNCELPLRFLPSDWLLPDARASLAYCMTLNARASLLSDRRDERIEYESVAGLAACVYALCMYASFVCVCVCVTRPAELRLPLSRHRPSPRAPNGLAFVSLSQTLFTGNARFPSALRTPRSRNLTLIACDIASHA